MQPAVVCLIIQKKKSGRKLQGHNYFGLPEELSKVTRFHTALQSSVSKVALVKANADLFLI